jgi:transposase
VRSKFKQELETLDPATIVYVDESGLEETLCREYGRCSVGKRLMGEKTGKRTSRTSIIAGLLEGKPIAPFHFPGYCNTEVVVTWAEKVLVPELKAGMTVIMDNASFHKSPRLEAVIQAVGCQLWFLPPYSPDFNPIEHYWARLKAKIRRFRETGMSLIRCLSKVFRMSI